MIANSAPGWFLEHAYLIPLIPAIAFVAIIAFGKRVRAVKVGPITIPGGGSTIGIASMVASLVLAAGAAIQWIQYSHAHEFAAPIRKTWVWWQAGGVEIGLGQHIDGLAVMALILVSFISSLVQIYSTEYLHGDIRSLLAVIALLKVWQPKDKWSAETEASAAVAATPDPRPETPDPDLILRAWVPWILLSVLVFIWGVPAVKQQLDALSAPKFSVPRLHNATVRTFPVVPQPTPEKPTKPEAAEFKLNWLSATGTGILLAGAADCATVLRSAIRDLFDRATQITRFMDAGVKYVLIVRPMVPGDAGC